MQNDDHLPERMRDCVPPPPLSVVTSGQKTLSLGESEVS